MCHFGSQAQTCQQHQKKLKMWVTQTPAFEPRMGVWVGQNGEDHTVLVLGPPEKGVNRAEDEVVLVKAPPHGGQQSQNRVQESTKLQHAPKFRAYPKFSTGFRA